MFVARVVAMRSRNTSSIFGSTSTAWTCAASFAMRRAKYPGPAPMSQTTSVFFSARAFTTSAGFCQASRSGSSIFLM